MNSKNNKFPIFIFGQTRRTGTNFLQSVLSQHSDCSPHLFPENNFLAVSNLLKSYSEFSWRMDFADKYPFDKYKVELMKNLGAGLLDFIHSNSKTERPILKSTTLVGLENFFDLFPQGKYLILIRDGRCTVESLVRTFSWEGKRPKWIFPDAKPMTYDDAIRKWAKSARQVIQLKENLHRNNKQVEFIKYEDLVLNAKITVKRILKFCDLDWRNYDFDKLAELPIIGSSQFKSNDPWKVTHALGPDFKPLERDVDWDSRLKKKFEKMAGKESRELGYF